MSNYVKATNFAVKDTLSTGDTNKIVRGAEIDTEFTAIASAIASKSDSNSPTFTGTPLAPTPASGTNNTQIATTAFVNTVVSGGIPSGVIVMWSGSIASIPSGWALCDGSNGTPNLRDRFVIGAGSSYAVGGTGGSKDAIVVAHTHTGSTSTASLSGTVTGISETFNVHGTASGSFSKLTGYNNPLTTIDNDNGNTGGFSFNGSHSHSFTTNSTGSSGTNANLPPYYALAYIMKA